MLTKTMKLFISISLILILSSCTLERYSLAHSQLKNKKYALAINNYDRYIKMSKNGAIKTIAEMERAEAYYQTGLKAFKLKKWELPIKKVAIKEEDNKYATNGRGFQIIYSIAKDITLKRVAEMNLLEIII